MKGLGMLNKRIINMLDCRICMLYGYRDLRENML